MKKVQKVKREYIEIDITDLCVIVAGILTAICVAVFFAVVEI